MVTKTVDIRVSQPSLEELITLVQEGAEVILTAGDTPLARVVRVERKKRVLGLHPGSIWTSDDFDEPLPDEFWLGDE